MSLKRRSLFAALLGATAVKGAECISGEAHGDFNSYEWEQCVDGRWVKRVGSDDSRNMRTPPVRLDNVDGPGVPGCINRNGEEPCIKLLPGGTYAITGDEPLSCPFNHDWEKVPYAFLSYTDPNLIDESSSGGSTPIPLSIGDMGPPVKPNPPIPGVSRCKRCGVLGMPK